MWKQTLIVLLALVVVGAMLEWRLETLAGEFQHELVRTGRTVDRIESRQNMSQTYKSGGVNVTYGPIYANPNETQDAYAARYLAGLTLFMKEHKPDLQQ